MAAPGTFILYAKNIPALRMADLLSATVKFALVKSTYAPNAAEDGHSLWSEVSDEEIAAGNGYTAGGAALASKAVEAITNGAKFASANVSWAASGGAIPAWRYAVMRVDGTLWGMTSPLIGYFVGDSAPADIPQTASGNELALKCPAAGWFDKVRA